MVGRALRKILPSAIYLSSKDDLRNLQTVDKLMSHNKPEFIIHLAAKVGGVKANMDYMGDFYHDNILINTNILESAKKHGVKKVISLLSTCVYPDKVTYPLTEDQIHNGVPHQSNYAYAYAKRMLDVQSRAYRDQHGCNFITAVPNNLFGEHDNFDLENSHVIPAILRKMYEAKLSGEDVILWGDGSPLREFTYAEDLSEIILFLLESYEQPEPINVGNTNEFSIKEIAAMIVDIIGFEGNIIWDTSQPSGQYRKPSSNKKLLDLGWEHEQYTDFKQALKNTCRWFIINYPNVRGMNK